MVGSKYSLCIMENNSCNLNYVQCLTIAPMEMGLWSQWSIIPLFLDPVEKTWFYEKLFFELAIVMVKDKKNTVLNFNQN